MKQLGSKLNQIFTIVNSIVRHLKLFLYFIRFSVMSVIIYRANSLFFGITPIIWMATNITFLSIIFGGGKEIGGWSYWEVMLLLGIHELVFLGTWMLFAENLERFTYDVRQGTFDRVLLKPVNHRFFISFNSMDFTAIGSLVNTIVILSLALSHLTIKMDFFKLLLFLVSLLSAYLIVYLLYFSISSLSLLFVNAGTFTDWLLEMTDFDRYPADIYGNIFRQFLFFGIPILFFAYVPTAVLLDKIPAYFVGLGILVVLWLYLISTIIWRVGLKRYQSASS